MNAKEVAAIVGRATALLLLILALADLIYALPDLLAITRYWQLAGKGPGEVYFLRYYLLFFAGHILSAGMMLYVANELRQGSPKLIAYLSGSSRVAE